MAAEVARQQKRGEGERAGDLRLYGPDALGMNFTNTFRFCPLLCLPLLSSLRLQSCMQRPFQVGGGKETRGGGVGGVCREADQWPGGLDFHPGAMVTGTNQYYIGMIVL